MDSHPTLDTLPNELLLSIISLLPTTALLPLAAVSHRIHAVTLRVLQQRLARAVSEPDRRLMLECYHPTEKLYTPYLYCDYLHTDPFAVPGEDNGKCLGEAYSHFRPVENDEDRSPGGAARRRNTRFARRLDVDNGGDAGDQKEEHRPPPWIDLYLDGDESFSQLCTITNLVRLGPKPGLFLSHVNVGEGVVRVWRDWLGARAQAAVAATAAAGGGEEAAVSSSEEEAVVLWADPDRDVGVRFRVTEKDIRGQHPVLVASDEQLPVAYRLEFEELLVKSTTLLIMVEKSEVQQVATEGKAIVLASF
ncbi:cyclin-like F-box protein [Corynascus novoguineensis]|uniref:Cyclin-like F-box protein n=1 Tax=Corynascus novoguineensis TaxID=1126955 RepID=A0AAN7D0B3_9PEZI|nr:cyclin-like F-box protein [Corynascus novoguineensis]